MQWRWILIIILLAVCGGAYAEELLEQNLLALLAHAPTAQDFPNDNAVCLLREVEVTVDAAGALTVRERKLVKLLNDQAQSLANWQIPYDKATETLEVPVARTLLNGRAFPVEPPQMVDSALFPGLAWYDSLVMRRFPLPSAIAGATLEVESIRRRATPRMPGDVSTRLQLQDVIPLCDGQYTLRVPTAMRLDIRFTGKQHPAISERERKGQRVYSWSVHNVPALRLTEPQTPPANDLIDTARITCWQRWEPVVTWYAGLTHGKDALTDRLRQAAETATAHCATAEEKIAALHKLVREIPYVALEMGNAGDTPHAADDVLQQHYGDCKDKATLLRALLHVVGIASDYVLVRTTERGQLDKQLYGPGEFNHVILAVAQPLDLARDKPGGDRFLDATGAFNTADRLPPGVEGADGLIIRGAGELVTLPVTTAAENGTDVRVTVAVKENGSATGSAVVTFTGQSAMVQRSMLARVPTERYREGLQGSLAARLGSEVTIDTVRVEHLIELEQPLLITAAFSSPAYLQPAGDQLSGNLPLFMYQANRFRGVTQRTLPFAQPLGSTLHLEAAITLPASLQITQTPAPVEYHSAIGDYRDTATSEGQTIHFIADLTVKRGLFLPDQLDELRKWAAIRALEGRNSLQFFLRRH